MNFVFIDITVTVHIGRRRNESFKAPRGSRALSASIRDIFGAHIIRIGAESGSGVGAVTTLVTYFENVYFSAEPALPVATQIQRLLMGKRRVASPVAWRISRVEQAGQLLRLCRRLSVEMHLRFIPQPRS
jgi:hypothetical protein